MKINEIITELFDMQTAYPLDWNQSVHNNGEAVASATDSNGDLIIIEFDPIGPPPKGDVVEIAFSRGGHYVATNKKDSGRVFATVLNAIDSYLKNHTPTYILFSAEGDSRISLYKSMIQRLAHGYISVSPDQYPSNVISVIAHMANGHPFVLKKQQ